MPTPREPADTIARSLAERGATVAFGLPGGGPNLDVVGALEAQGLRFVLAHAETSACIMAATFGHLTGTISAAVVTRGPGVASAVNGAAQATLDRFPLVLITDCVPRASAARVPHQRLDQPSLLRPVCKGGAVVSTQTRSVDDLLDLALAEPPGAVHLEYDAGAPHEDFVTNDNAFAGDPDPCPVSSILAGAERPVVILGRAAVPAASGLLPILEAYGAPVLTTYQAIGVVPTGHPLNGGLFTNGASERPLLERADRIVVVGLDPVEPIPAAWNLDAPVVSIAPIPTLDAYTPIAAEVVGDLVALSQALLTPGQRGWGPAAGADHREAVRRRLRRARSQFGPVELVDAVAAVCPSTITITVDAGAHFLAVMPLWGVDEPDRLLISNGLATMGFAIPAAIGAALARPAEPVLAFVGDGGLGMTVAELETISRLRLPITVVVLNDAALSLIGIKQRQDHGGPDAVRYRPIDFARVARAHGIDGVVVESPAEATSALVTGWDRPRLIDARVDPTPYADLLEITRG